MNKFKVTIAALAFTATTAYAEPVKTFLDEVDKVQSLAHLKGFIRLGNVYIRKADILVVNEHDSYLHIMLRNGRVVKLNRITLKQFVKEMNR